VPVRGPLDGSSERMTTPVTSTPPARSGARRVLLSVGLILLVGAPLVWGASLPPRETGVPPGVAATATALAPAPSEPRAATSPSDAGRPSALPADPLSADPPPAVATAPAPPWTTTAPTGAIDPGRWPVEVRLPTLGIVAPVEEVGLTPDGDVGIPDSPRSVGWFRGAAVPGDPGTAVLASHVDSRREGLGVFAGLVRVAVGDRVELVAADGTTTLWTIVAREQVPKDELPSGRLFGLAGGPALALVTCGGRFDAAARSYTDNVIVWAVPAA